MPSCRAARCRSAASPATSRRPCLADLLCPGGEAKNTYGTGCFLLMNTGETLCESKNGLLSTIAVGLDGKVQYALEGSVFIGGAVIQWLRDEMRFFTESQDAEYYAGKVEDTGGVYLCRPLPAWARPIGICTPGAASWA